MKKGDGASSVLHGSDLVVVGAGLLLPGAEPFAIGYGGGRVAGDLAVLLSNSEGSVLDKTPKPAGCP